MPRIVRTAWIVLVACRDPVATTPPDEPRTAPELPKACGAAVLDTAEVRLVEGAPTNVSNVSVVVDHVKERWIVEPDGPTGHEVSAAISTPHAKATWIAVGSDVAIGVDRYCVVAVEYGRGEPSSVTLQKITG